MDREGADGAATATLYNLLARAPQTISLMCQSAEYEVKGDNETGK